MQSIHLQGQIRIETNEFDYLYHKPKSYKNCLVKKYTLEIKRLTVIGSFRRACTIKLETTRPSFICIRGP